MSLQQRVIFFVALIFVYSGFLPSLAAAPGHPPPPPRPAKSAIKATPKQVVKPAPKPAIKPVSKGLHSAAKSTAKKPSRAKRLASIKKRPVNLKNGVSHHKLQSKQKGRKVGKRADANARKTRRNQPLNASQQQGKTLLSKHKAKGSKKVSYKKSVALKKRPRTLRNGVKRGGSLSKRRGKSSGKRGDADARPLTKSQQRGKSLIKDAKRAGRAGKQARLRELANDPKLGRADRGWLKQEKKSIARGNRKTIRNPPGKDLAHERGREAAKGYGYEHSKLQDRKLHRLQHKYDNFGRKNQERPPK